MTTPQKNRVFFVRTTDGETHKGVELPRHVVRFRRHFGCEFLADEFNSEQLTWMAWQTITNGEGSFDDWLDQVETLELDVEDAAPLVRPSAKGRTAT